MTMRVASALPWGIRAGILLLLLMPFLISPGTVNPLLVGRTIYARVLIEIVAALWVVLAIANPTYRPSRSLVIRAMLLFLVVSVIAAVADVSPTRSIWSTYDRMMGVWGLVHWFLLALVLASTLRLAKDRALLLNGILVSILALEVVALAQA